MFQTYFKVALRNLKKSAFFTAINIIGLTLSLVVSLSIYLYVQSESNYDTYHPNVENQYRLVLDRIYPDHVSSYAVTPASIGEAIFNELPEVQSFTRLWRPLAEVTIDFESENRVELGFLMTDANFFETFGIQLIQGDRESALSGGNSIVITEDMSRKYFGQNDPMGKVLSTSIGDYVISGVVEDTPVNTHFTFDFLANISLHPILRNPNYVNFAVHNYLTLQKGATLQEVEAQLPTLVKKYASGPIQRITGISYDEYIAAGNGYGYYLQKISDIHLRSQLQNELGVNGNMTYIYILISVGVFVFILAIVNFVNLSTARSFDRAKEVGVRKVLGSDRKRLIFQFLTESVVLSVISFFLADILVIFLVPGINSAFDASLDYSILISPLTILGVIVLAALTGILAGLYPAFALSSFKSITVLKGKFRSSKRAIMLRHALMIFQFWISTILICSTLIVQKQLDFLQNTSLGFDQENVLVVERAELLGDAEVFKSEVSKINAVNSAGGASALPGDALFFGSPFRMSGSSETQALNCVMVDDDYVSTMGIGVISGRSFGREYQDSLSVMINEKAIETLGISGDPIGQTIRNIIPRNLDDSRDFTIVGVIRDYHFESLHMEITPMVMLSTETVSAAKNYYPMQPLNSISIRLHSGDLKETIASIEQVWNGFVPGTAMDYYFLDERLDKLYSSEMKLGRFFTAFSSLAILIAVIGLFGLSAYISRLRIKEIGVRKVLGSSVGSILLLFQKYFGKLILLSILLAVPTVIVLMNGWLNGFAYRINIEVGVVLAASFLSFFITAVTVMIQSYKAAVTDPVVTLKAE
ncbi:MAG: ABC transporter permease [Cyclobacteriaceae bacterium]